MESLSEKGGAALLEATPSNVSDCKQILATEPENVNAFTKEERENNAITNLTLRFKPKSPAYPQMIQSRNRLIEVLGAEPIPTGCRPPIASGRIRKPISLRNVETFTCNIYHLMTTTKDTLSVPLSHNAYAGKDKVNAGYLNLIRLAEQRRLIVLQRGFHDRIHNENSRHARFKPSPELIAIIGTGIGPDDLHSEPHHLVNLHDDDGKDVPRKKWKLSAEHRRLVQRVERELRQANELLSAFTITYQRLSKAEQHPRPNSGRNKPSARSWRQRSPHRSILYPVLYAVFTGDFNHGGRIYTGKGGHTNLRKGERATIRIEDEPTVELDFGGLHIRMLYHKRGEAYPLDADPYCDVARVMGIADPEEFFNQCPKLRGDLKELLLGLINGDGSEEKAIANADFRLFRRYFSIRNREERNKVEKECSQCAQRWQEAGLFDAKEEPTCARVIRAFKEAHTPIADYFSTGCGLELQAIDSRIARAVIRRLMLTNPKLVIPALPVHDSFIVPARFEDEARQAMADSYQAEMRTQTSSERDFLIPIRTAKRG